MGYSLEKSIFFLYISYWHEALEYSAEKIFGKFEISAKLRRLEVNRKRLSLETTFFKLVISQKLASGLTSNCRYIHLLYTSLYRPY